MGSAAAVEFRQESARFGTGEMLGSWLDSRRASGNLRGVGGCQLLALTEAEHGPEGAMCRGHGRCGETPRGEVCVPVFDLAWLEVGEFHGAPAWMRLLLPEVGRSNYQFLGEIARGGMGVILKGHDTDLGRDVAVKRQPRQEDGEANRRAFHLGGCGRGDVVQSPAHAGRRREQRADEPQE